MNIKCGKYKITMFDLGIKQAYQTRLEENSEVLTNLLQTPTVQGKPILLFLNKQDVPGALDENEATDKLNLENLVNTYRCPTRLETCSAVRIPGRPSDASLKDGFQWLLDFINIPNSWSCLSESRARRLQGRYNWKRNALRGWNELNKLDVKEVIPKIVLNQNQMKHLELTKILSKRWRKSNYKASDSTVQKRKRKRKRLRRFSSRPGPATATLQASDDSEDNNTIDNRGSIVHSSTGTSIKALPLTLRLAELPTSEPRPLTPPVSIASSVTSSTAGTYDHRMPPRRER